jgi:hypothetical protein
LGKLRGGAAGRLLDPFNARVEAFISAMRRAPVTLGPIPKEVANAGTRIMEVKAKPVASNKDPLERVCLWTTAIWVLLMVDLFSMN